MRVGIDARPMAEIAGVGRYTSELLEQLVKEFPEVQFVLFFGNEPVFEPWLESDNVEVVQFSSLRIPFISSHILDALTIARAQLNAFHSTAYVAPWFLQVPLVVTLHDLAIYEHPEWFASQLPFSRWFLVPHTVRNAERIISVSEATSQQARDLFHVDSHKLVTVYEGAARHNPNSPDVRDQYGIEGEYMLFVGTIEPRKNLEALVRAYDLLDTEVNLVIAGAEGWKTQDVYDAIDGAASAQRIHVLGRITDDERDSLLHHAQLLVFPSLWEGFGLPVVEALAAGIPVVSSHAGALPEVAGNGAEYVDPYDVSDIARGMRVMLNEPERRAMRAEEGLAHVQQFTWTRAAYETMEVYRQAANEDIV